MKKSSFKNNQSIKFLSLLGAITLLIALPITIFLSQKQQEVKGNAAGCTLHVQGPQIIDCNNQPFILRGAMMESAFAYINKWPAQDPTAFMNTKTFNVMHSWNMNAIRINISQWIQQKDTTGTYLTKLDLVIQQANQAGLYVILDFHDNTQSGSPYGDQMLHSESTAWWQSIATRYKSNSMIMYDLENEPKYTDWQTWAHGNGSGITGFVDVTTAIRATGAQQIIIYEPGQAGGHGAGWVGFNPGVVTDSNIMYSKHEYSNVITGNSALWDQDWGSILGNHPIFYGEWAVLANAAIPSHCIGLTSSNADQITNAFLNYLQSRNANWTYWDFEPYRLIQDYTTYTPTNFQTGAPWVCPNGIQDGAGVDVKNFLSNHASPPPTGNTTPSITGNPSATNPPTATPLPGGGITFNISVCPHGLGNCGDNVNPNSGGNTNPLHPQRNIALTVLNANSQTVATSQGTVNYNTTAKNFHGNISTGTLPNGAYLVKVKLDGFLQKQIPGIITINSSNQTIILSQVALVNGDINNDGQLDIVDYNLLINCFGSKAGTSSCQSKTASDINDDGSIDGVDYNLFLRELSVQRGDNGGGTPTPTNIISSTPTLTQPVGVGIHKIQHVVVIMQENRSFDHYFGTYPGAEGFPSNYCVPNSVSGHCIKPFHLTADLNQGGLHTAAPALSDIDGGKMDGFINTICPAAAGCATDALDIMGYKDRTDIPNYWSYADNFVLQDHMFQSVHTWSQPTHMSLVSGWEALCSSSSPMSCTSNLDLSNVYTNHAWTDITYLMHKNNISWAYYLDSGVVPQIWNPLPGFNDVTSDGQQTNVTNLSNFFTALQNGNAPAVSWIIPKSSDSEHPPALVSTGQAYVTNIVNKIMTSSSWNSTAIFITWDDWGGYFDHVAPPQIDQNGYGIRVPGLLISPYAKKAYIDKQTLSFDAYLKFIEDDFLNGQRLNPQTDGRPDSRPDVRETSSQLGDLTSEFDFTQTPRPPLTLAINPNPNQNTEVAGTQTQSYPWWYSLFVWFFKIFHV